MDILETDGGTMVVGMPYEELLALVVPDGPGGSAGFTVFQVQVAAVSAAADVDILALPRIGVTFGRGEGGVMLVAFEFMPEA